LVSHSDEIINDLRVLEGKNFLEITGSAQRLAWNTLDNLGINYKIVKLLKSPNEAFKIVKISENLYTFLNSSFATGSELLAEETNHILTMVIFNPEDRQMQGFVEYINGRGRKLIKEMGFQPF
jgi:hypothetical protein